MSNDGRTQIGPWLARNKWLIGFAVVVVLGYSIGKDFALRENARDGQPAGIDAGR